MDDIEKRQKLQAKFASALANPLPGKRPILKLIRPHFKRPPFNRTHKILRRRHRKKDKNFEHYNVPVTSYYALRWVKADHPVEPGPGIIVSLEQFADIPRAVMPSPHQSPQQPPSNTQPPDNNSVAQEPPAASGPKHDPPPPLKIIYEEEDDDDDDESEVYSQEGEVIFNGDSRSLPGQSEYDFISDMPWESSLPADDDFAPIKKKRKR